MSFIDHLWAAHAVAIPSLLLFARGGVEMMVAWVLVQLGLAAPSAVEMNEMACNLLLVGSFTGASLGAGFAKHRCHIAPLTMTFHALSGDLAVYPLPSDPEG